MTKRVFYLALAALTATAILTVVSHYVSPLPPVFLVAIRWITLAVFVAYACFRRTLTAWIVVAMLIGATLGHDWPSLAVNLRVIAQIFLRLIKTIIAPLLFATLVSGIAAHSDLKKVGRMGVKALSISRSSPRSRSSSGWRRSTSARPESEFRLTARAATLRATRGRKSHGRTRCCTCCPRTSRNLLPTDRSCRSSFSAFCLALRWRWCREERRRPLVQLTREPGRDDVQVHEHRDVVCAAGRGRGDRLYGGQHGHGHPGESGEAAGHALCGAVCVCVWSAAADRADRARPDPPIYRALRPSQ